MCDYEGNMYEGSWLNNLKHGRGRQVFANGDVYTGEWKEGKIDGEGKMILSNWNSNFNPLYLHNMTAYRANVGGFPMGLKNGKGLCFDKIGGDINDGSWQFDKMTGKGKYTNKQE